MKLSEAIRVGATDREQCVSRPFKDISCLKLVQASAIGSAWIALNPDKDIDNDPIPTTSNVWKCIGKHYPDIMQDYTCPVSGNVDRLGWVIEKLEYQHSWTREQIADWLERKGL